MFSKMQKQILALVLCLLQCLLVTGLQGRNYYIAINGDDANNGLYPTNGSAGNGPWKTLNKVNSASFKAGDSILFRRGDSWTGTGIKANKAGSAGAYIVYGAYGTGTKPTINNEGMNIDASWVAVENIIFRNTSANGIARSSGQHLIIRNCEVYGAGQNGIRIKGLGFSGFEDILVEGCHVEGSAVDNITCHKGANKAEAGYGITFRNNMAIGATEEGYDCTTGSQILFEGNSSRDNADGSVVTGHGVHDVVVRKHFSFNDGDALKVKKTNNIRYEYSVFMGNKNLIKFSQNPGEGSTSNLEIYNCVFWQTGSATFLSAEQTQGPVKFKNNIFGSSGSSSLFTLKNTEKLGAGGNYTFDYNFYYKPNASVGTAFFSSSGKSYSVQDLKSQFANEQNGMMGNPEFINGMTGLTDVNDFLISSGSPLINEGIIVGATSDYFDTPLASNEIPDIGIAEFGSSTGGGGTGGGGTGGGGTGGGGTGGGGTTTPYVEWLSFTASPDYPLKKVVLKWATAKELGNTGFMVQRSQDQIVFEDIMAVAAIGNSTTTTQYSADDLYPMEGDMYYRIKQTSSDGKFTYSSVVKVNYAPSTEAQITAFPTQLPVGSAITITVPIEGAVTVIARVFDTNGKKLASKQIRTENGTVKYRLPEFIPVGYYILSVTAGTEQRAFQIWVQ
ncbi:MAG: right-handed parallel beta-helix repeat-containing protein [Bacteroidia bacterium]|nr:right-handed parallel beta-helix repeat-containing protein [Bacteroidia bacterium]